MGTGEELAKTEIHRSHTLERVTSFDKTTLKATITEEKVILPDTDTLSMEKENQGRDKIMSDISSFESSTLKATEIEQNINRRKIKFARFTRHPARKKPIKNYWRAWK